MLKGQVKFLELIAAHCTVDRRSLISPGWLTTQLTGEPKQADAPDSIFAPIAGYDTVEGNFGNLSVPSFTDWLNRNPSINWGAIAVVAACGLIAMLSGISG